MGQFSMENRGCLGQLSVEINSKDLFGVANKALVILWRIKMRVNPLTTNPQAALDKEFLARLAGLLQPPPPDPNGVSPPEAMWRKLAEEAVAQSQIVFKGEWEVTKTTMLQNIWDAWKARKKEKQQPE